MALMEELLLKGYIDENMDEMVKNATADYLIRLLTYCAKADGYISNEERNFIINYIIHYCPNMSTCNFKKNFRPIARPLHCTPHAYKHTRL